ncbi:hypothetical protein WUBG_15507 [Wuchereria bancrofti]|uniref:Uncharacterized protein n=1 Tax=Wuchereria bancrofti TaxID=6293 RepID=J9EDV4_WUCBA|nr:hypothetical protein WUBG_15507 [Wuchereria bancrofti]
MGRRNTTFTGADIIRMLASNISRSEQDDVILFLYLVIPEIAVDRIERRIFGEGMTARGVSSGRSIISWILLARRLVNLLTSLEEMMPRKRQLEVRMAEAEAKLDDMKLEMAIKQLREKRAIRRPRRRSRR